MLRVAICDANREDIDRSRRLAVDFSDTHPQTPVDVRAYRLAYDLLEEVGKTGGFDIYLLDVVMPHMTGVDLARRIRARKERAEILFLTVSREYAVEAFDVKAAGYLIKPVTKLSLEHNLDKALKFLWRKQQLKLLIKSKDGQLVVRASDIVYIEVERHNLYFHIMTAEGIKSIRTRGTMREMYDALKEMNFAKCSACYLINMNYITAINKSKIECAGGVVLFISRKSQKEFMTHFMKYIDEQGGVNV